MYSKDDLIILCTLVFFFLMDISMMDGNVLLYVDFI